jgi:diacylglycerol O-acyltransferase / wax synthase
MPVQRLSANDLTMLATDKGQVPMNIAAALEFADVADAESFVQTLASRLIRIPRMRQRLLRPGFGAGRPLWVDADDLALADHVHATQLPPAVLVCRRLDPDRPLWALYWTVDGPAVTVVIVLHHVVADGLGGLGALGALVDGVSIPHAPGVAPPNVRQLRADAHRRRMAALKRAPQAMRETVAGAREMGLTVKRPKLLPASSILQPTSAARELRVVDLDLAPVVEASHRQAVTVNDLILSGVSGCLEGLLSKRGEHPPEVVISVPVSGRTGNADVGNEVGAIPIAVPTGLGQQQRLLHIHRAMGRAKSEQRGSSAAVLGLVFRTLATVGVGNYFVNHQRLVHTFETNLRGPSAPLVMNGKILERIVPIAINPGNVGVSFDVLSYAGRLTISVVACPRTVPEIDWVAETLRAELTALL